jgi:4-amino-4-deoxy-L-arabinose transferase-like glycosyltransferase
LAAAALRFPFLDHQSLWFDETYTRSILAAPNLSGLWDHIRATESTPPLYYFLSWLIGAHSAAAMRLIPALALVAAVPVSFFAFRRLIGSRSSAATAWLLAVSPALVSYSTDARAYGLLVLTGLLTVWTFSRLIVDEDPGWGSHMLWAVACAACVWTHYFGAFLVGAEVIVLLLVRPERRPMTFASVALMVILALPLIPLITRQTGDERSAYIAGIGLQSRVATTVRQFGMGSNVPRAWLEGVGLAFWWLGVLAGAMLALRRGQPVRLLVVVLVISLGLPLAMSVFNLEDRFYVRNMITAVPLLAAVAVPALLRLRAAPLVAYLVLAALTSVWVATNWRYEQTDWRDALGRVLHVDAQAPVLAVTTRSVPVAEVYLNRSPVPGEQTLTRRLWVVVEPVRGPHDRALVPAPAPSLAGFTVQRRLLTHAFVLELLGAPRPRLVNARALPGTTLFPGQSAAAR